jgi:predicted Zn-dependent protease
MRLPFAMLTVAVLIASAQKAKDDVNRIGDREIGNCLNFYSLEKEIALGKQLAEEVSRQAKLNQDPIVGEFINRMGQNLVRNSDAKVAFTFRVVEDNTPNAFALPGGFVFINTGLIKLASEEAELAGAVAHEIAHVAARHMTCQASKQQIAGIASIPVAIVLGGGLGGYVGRQGADAATRAAFLKLSRGAETEADYLGTQYLYAAGYDPNGAISIFEKMESLRKTKAGVWDRLLSSHPMDADRIDKTQKEIQRILPAKSEYIVTTSEYASVRERVISTPAQVRPTLRRRDLVQ